MLSLYNPEEPCVLKLFEEEKLKRLDGAEPIALRVGTLPSDDFRIVFAIAIGELSHHYTKIGQLAEPREFKIRASSGRLHLPDSYTLEQVAENEITALGIHAPHIPILLNERLYKSASESRYIWNKQQNQLDWFDK